MSGCGWVGYVTLCPIWSALISFWFWRSRLTLIFRYYCLTLNSRLKKIWHYFRLQSSRMLAQCRGRRVDVPRDSKQILQLCCFSFNQARPRASSLTLLDLLPSTMQLASKLSLTLLLLPLLHLLRHRITPIPSAPQVCSTLYAASPVITLPLFSQNLTCFIFYTFFSCSFLLWFIPGYWI